MDPRQVELVQESWRSVLPVGDTMAELFYGKLFSLDPSIQALFKSDLKDQGRNLTAMMTVAVGALSKPERIMIAVRQLGSRHLAYGVQARHYALVEAALLWALEKVLAETFTPEVRAAWTAVYALLATTMQSVPCAPKSRA